MWSEQLKEGGVFLPQFLHRVACLVSTCKCGCHLHDNDALLACSSNRAFLLLLWGQFDKTISGLSQDTSSKQRERCEWNIWCIYCVVPVLVICKLSKSTLLNISSFVCRLMTHCTTFSVVTSQTEFELSYSYQHYPGVFLFSSSMFSVVGAVGQRLTCTRCLFVCCWCGWVPHIPCLWVTEPPDSAWCLNHCSWNCLNTSFSPLTKTGLLSSACLQTLL